MKHTQIDDQHAQRENVETNPEIEQDGARKCQEIINVLVRLLMKPGGILPSIQQSKFHSRKLFLPSSFAVLPIVPQPKSLEQIHTVGIPHGLLDLVVSKAWADFVIQVG